LSGQSLRVIEDRHRRNGDHQGRSQNQRLPVERGCEILAYGQRRHSGSCHLLKRSGRTSSIETAGSRSDIIEAGSDNPNGISGKNGCT
jgi:hypothetical protein